MDLNIPAFVNTDIVSPRPERLGSVGTLALRLVEIDCQSDGERPGTACISFDLASRLPEGPGDAFGAFWIEPTKSELVALIAELQAVVDNSDWATPGYGSEAK